MIKKIKRKLLSNFFGILSKESGERLAKTIYELRKKRNEAHETRIKNIIKEFKNTPKNL